MTKKEITKKIIKGDPIKLFLIQKQCPGDILTLTASVRDLKLKYPNVIIGIDTSSMPIWDYNPHIDLKMTEKDADVVIRCEYPLVDQSNSCGKHFIHGFKDNLEDQLGIKFELTSFQCDVHLSEEEMGWTSQIAENGYNGKFWLICNGWKNDFPLKRYPVEKWQIVVDMIKKHFGNRLMLVQVGEKHPEHHHPPMKNTFNLIGKTDLRQLIRLAWHAEGSLCHITMLNHLMSVWNKPCVVVAGGRESATWEKYNSTRYIDMAGVMHCAEEGSCWKSHLSECLDIGENGVPQCMNLTHPEDIFNAFISFYDGGRLTV